ncbi:MAG: GNAT family N-acetyltransferase [Gammaproteobacteria bacterium]|nr:GNAT family N-acetyltransferase [Gammaproteobacteria bacterium]
MTSRIRTAHEADAGAIAVIYNHYIAESCITFETDPVSEADMATRIRDTLAIPLPWLVAEASGRIAGYAYASKWKGRCAYRFAVETTIYLDPDATGGGAGTRLYTALIDAVRAASMRSAIGGIALPNDASIRLHENLGFRKVGHFERVGYKHDKWIDVGYWQLQL